MKKIIIRIVQFLFISTLFFNFPKISLKVLAVETKVWNEIVDALNKETEAYDSYILFTKAIEDLNQEQLIKRYISDSISWERNFHAGKLVYEKYTSSSDAQLSEVANKALNASVKSLEAINQYDKGFMEEDLTNEEIQSYLTKGDSLINESSIEHYEAVDLYNDYSGYNSQNGLIIFLYLCLILSLIFTIILWFKSKSSSYYQSDIVKAQIFKNLFGNSIWLLVGVAITVISYSSVKSGGTYYIYWGPIAIGGWKMLSGLWTYFTKDRKTLRQMRIQASKDLLTKTMKGE